MRSFQLVKSKVEVIEDQEGFKIKHRELNLLYCGNNNWDKGSISNLVFRSDKKVREFLNCI